MRTTKEKISLFHQKKWQCLKIYENVSLQKRRQAPNTLLIQKVGKMTKIGNIEREKQIWC